MSGLSQWPRSWLIRIYRETERNWDLDLAEDVKGEVEGKYGKVKRIKVDKMTAVSGHQLYIVIHCG